MKDLYLSTIVLCSTLLSLAGCSSSSDSGGSHSSAVATVSSASTSSSTASSKSYQLSTSPVATPPPNAENQTPYFPGQTRAPEILQNVPFNTTIVATNLDHPWGVTLLPSGQLLITERSGNLRVVNGDGFVSAPVTGVPAVNAVGQGGLLDVSLSPTFVQDRLVYLSYAEPRGNNQTGTSVARGKLSADASALENVEVIFRQTPAWASTLHYGSRIVWDSTQHLYITLGERSLPAPRQLAQDLDTHLGKVVRLNADGSSPIDNPFFMEGGLPEIWSYGHRNIQGAAIDPNTDRLWTIEHGPKGGDELNQPMAGKNYGWPIITYGIDYSGADIGAGITQQEGMEQPVYYWDPVIAPGGMLFYSGGMFEEWAGSLFICSLNPGALVRLILEDGNVIGEQRLLTNIGRVRDIEQGADGALWVLTDADNGQLIKISR